jgi:hypothetical protein
LLNALLFSNLTISPEEIGADDPAVMVGRLLHVALEYPTPNG